MVGPKSDQSDLGPKRGAQGSDSDDLQFFRRRIWWRSRRRTSPQLWLSGSWLRRASVELAERASRSPNLPSTRPGGVWGLVSWGVRRPGRVNSGRDFRLASWPFGSASPAAACGFRSLRRGSRAPRFFPRGPRGVLPATPLCAGRGPAGPFAPPPAHVFRASPHRYGPKSADIDPSEPKWT